MRRIDLKRANVARLDTIREINRQIVLNYVREREPISRNEIAQETELHRSTVSSIIDELVGNGLIEEFGAGESTGGRPPMLLRIRAGGAVAVGADIGTSRTVVATCDLAGRVLAQERFATPSDPQKALAQVVECVLKFREESGTIERVGVSLPGIVDPETGVALYVPYFGWRDLPVTHVISSATKLPATADNDANAAALAELWLGRPEVREARDFILVLVEDGIGTGIVFDGQVYHGERGVAGEFGHMTIGTGAPVACASGSYECWEAFASERAALARYARLSGAEDAGRVSMDELIDRALGGCTAAVSALVETARYLGVGVSNLIKGMSPESVIVSGTIVRAWPLIEKEIKRVVEESHCSVPLTLRITPSSLGEQPTLMGAFSLVLAGKFSAVVPA